MNIKFILIFLGMMVLIILIYVEGQTNSPIFIHQPPDPVPIFHLTKREKHPPLLHECIVYEVEGCSRKPIYMVENFIDEL